MTTTASIYQLLLQLLQSYCSLLISSCPQSLWFSKHNWNRYFSILKQIFNIDGLFHDNNLTPDFLHPLWLWHIVFYQFSWQLFPFTTIFACVNLLLFLSIITCSFEFVHKLHKAYLVQGTCLFLIHVLQYNHFTVHKWFSFNSDL